MRRIILALMLALVIAAITGGTAFAGFASAKPNGHVVRPGQSIQKAINAADPGDTIVVSGVHHEDVVIRKNGITLVGDNAVLKPPATGDLSAMRAFACLATWTSTLARFPATYRMCP